ncbi:hypothetical protein ACLBR5_24470 [Escherichia coli]
MSVTAGERQEPLFGPVLNIKVFDYQLDIPGVQTQTHTLGPVNDLELALFPDEHGDFVDCRSSPINGVSMSQR